MKYLKAVGGGIVGTLFALVLAWLLGAIATTAYLNYHRGNIEEAFPLPMWTAWFILPIPFAASAGGFWAGFRFMLRRATDF